MSIEERLFNTIYCGIVCETIGAQYENIPMKHSNLTKPIIPNRIYTDDTDMTMLIVRIFIKYSLNELDSYTIHKLYSQYFDPKRGYSKRTRNQLLSIKRGEKAKPIQSNTNGCIMRASPMIALMWNLNDEEMVLGIKKCISLTHDHPEAVYTTFLYIKTVKYLLSKRNFTISDIISFIQGIPMDKEDKYQTFSLLKYLVNDKEITLENFNYMLWGKSYVFHITAFECYITALFLFLKNLGNPERALKECVVFGGDVDTVAKILGDFCGAVYGLEWLNKDWLNIEDSITIQHDIRNFLTKNKI